MTAVARQPVGPLPYKVCGCGAVYSRAAWARLLPVRVQEVDRSLHLELRDCRHCHSTLAVELFPIITEADRLDAVQMAEAYLAANRRLRTSRLEHLARRRLRLRAALLVIVLAVLL